MERKWQPRERDELSHPSQTSRAVEAATHPLAGGYVERKDDAASANFGTFDPLSDNSDAAGYDPLSRLSAASPSGANATAGGPADGSGGDRNATSPAAAEDKALEGGAEIGSGAESDSSFRPWVTRKADILRKYTSNESIAIQVNFLDTPAPEPTLNGKPVDKTQQRLDNLDKTAESREREIANLTQQEYLRHIEDLHAELIHAWNADERVKSLKIAIQCAKVLSDTSVIKFYPSKFVLVSEILDTFGKLVYQRITERSLELGNDGTQLRMLPRNWTSDDIPAHAKETCRNWFYKIASIRELVPRMYVEMAIMRNHGYLTTGTFPAIVRRLSYMTRGIGDPIVQMYCRAYLSRKALEVLPDAKEHLHVALTDYCQILKSLEQSPRLERILAQHRISTADYHDLFTPALEWTLQCTSRISQLERTNAGEEGLEALRQSLFERALRTYRYTKNGLLLSHIMFSFPPNTVANNSLVLTQLVREADETKSKHLLYITLGARLVESSPPLDQRMIILNDIWKVVTKFEDITKYMAVAAVYIDYPLKLLTPKEVNIILGDILRHVKNYYENQQEHILTIINKVLNEIHDFDVLFNKMENFLPFLDLVKGEAQNKTHRYIVDSFAKSKEPTSNPLIITAVFNSAKVVHDSLNALSLADDIRSASLALSAFARNVSYGRDVEKQLNFYTDCRRAFANLDLVKRQLVLSTCDLTMKTLSLVGGKHNKKTTAFVRATLAFCYITIPSLYEVFPRLDLYLVAGSVGFQNGAAPQSEALLKAAITLIQDIPTVLEINGEVKSTEDLLVSFVQRFCALLVAVPGHPTSGPFMLIKGLIKVLADHEWETPAARARISLASLSLLAALAQPILPYHFVTGSVESNDTLYGGSEEYMRELFSLCDGLIDDFLTTLSKMKEDPDKLVQRQQAGLALQLFNCTVAFAEPTAQSATLAAKVFALAQHTGASREQLNSALSFLLLHRRAGTPFAELHAKLAGSA